jgi:cell division protein FtsN
MQRKKQNTSKNTRKRNLKVKSSSGGEGKSLLIMTLSAIGVISAFALLSWYAYNHYKDLNNPKGIIYIKADKSPFKIKPEDPGGLKIDYREKEIFGVFSDKKEDFSKEIKKIEDSKPLTKDEIFERAKNKAQQEKLKAEQEERKLAEAKVAEQKAIEAEKVKSESKQRKIIINDDSLVASKDKRSSEEAEILNMFARDGDVSSKEGNIEVNSSVEVPKIEGEQKYSNLDIAKVTKPNKLSLPGEEPEKKEVIKLERDPDTKRAIPRSMRTAKTSDFLTSKKSSSDKKFFVQISSHKNMDELERSWLDFKSRFSEFTSSYKREVQEVLVSGAKFYRLGYGSFDSSSKAKSSCQKLKSKGHDCFVQSL